MNCLILHTLLELYWFLCKWYLLLDTFVTLLLHCLNLCFVLWDFVLNLFISSRNCLLILLILHLGPIHDAFISYWVFLLNAFVMHAWLYVWNTYVSYTWWFGFHTWSILYTLVFFKEHGSLYGSIYWFQSIISLYWLINHFVVCRLYWYIMQWRSQITWNSNSLRF